MANASVAAVIVADLSICIENNCTLGIIVVGRLLVNELVSSDISSWWHD